MTSLDSPLPRRRDPAAARPRFPLGQLVATPGAIDAVPPPELARAVARHQSGDWGDIDPDDRAENDHALDHGFRLLSAYRTKGGTRFWVLTEADRSVTTVLLPGEY
jgi:hypothetical protein